MSSTCAICGGTGFEIRTREDGVSSAARCSCSEEDRGRRLLEAARVPRRYDHCSFEEFAAQTPSLEQALAVAREWVERWPLVDQGILFIGKPGMGKTHLAVAMIRELTSAKSARVLFREQRELLKSLQGTYDAGASLSESEVLGPVLSAEVLVLDDLGAGRMTAWARDVMHDVIVHRYNNKLPILMTTNHATGDDDPESRTSSKQVEGVTLRDRLGDALMSRIYEMCLMVPVEGRIDFRKQVHNAGIRF